MATRLRIAKAGQPGLDRGIEVGHQPPPGVGRVGIPGDGRLENAADGLG